MIISKNQMMVFDAAALNHFKERLITHARTCFPEQFGMIGPKLMWSFIEFGVASAQRYGFRSERDICNYIDLMMVFGPGYDTDTRTPWAAAFLKDEKISPQARMPTLLAHAFCVLRALAT